MIKKEKQIVRETENFVKKLLKGEGTGHDFWHAYRVRRIAERLSKNEKGVNLFVIQLAALLHDIADWKFYKNETYALKTIRTWLSSLGVDNIVTDHICEIVKNISFLSGKMKTKEGMIVQDADRLDAMGAIGIARTFAYGGFKRRELHNPHIKPRTFSSLREYRNNKGTTINHFYEKLLLLKNQLNTKGARKIATSRHNYLKHYLRRFYEEWKGNL